MNRKTVSEIGAVLAAILFFMGLLAKGESKAIYISAAFLMIFLVLSLLVKGENSNRWEEKEKENYIQLEGTTVNSSYDPIGESAKDRFTPAVKVFPMEDCMIRVLFENGVTKTYDMRNSMRKHEELKILLADKELFDKVRITVGGYRISWNGSLCIATTEVWKNGVIEGENEENVDTEETENVNLAEADAEEDK
jgi:hypothetical protein